jgi:hypothetical protein
MAWLKRLTFWLLVSYYIIEQGTSHGSPAGNYGTGRRAGGVSTLICALLDEGGSKDGEITKLA